MTALDVYLITRSCELHELLYVPLFLSIGVLAGFFAVAIISWVEEDTDSDTFKRSVEIVKSAVITIVIITLLIIITPDKKTLAAMYVIPHITTGETAEQMTQLPPNILKFLNEYLSDEKGEK